MTYAVTNEDILISNPLGTTHEIHAVTDHGVDFLAQVQEFEILQTILPGNRVAQITEEQLSRFRGMADRQGVSIVAFVVDADSGEPRIVSWLGRPRHDS